MSRVRRLVIHTGAVGLLCGGAPARAQDIPDPNSGPEAIAKLSEAGAIAGILQQLNARAPSSAILLRDVRVVDPEHGLVSRRVSVLVRDGRIARVLASPRAPAPVRTFVVDGGGHYLAPGLVDSHFHTNSTAAPLLNLAAGVTSVREMDGFPWMLHWRANARQRRMLAPVPYVAGTIINGVPLDGYAVVAATPEAARAIVDEQARCGFEFIKIHNVLRPEVFDAVAGQAKKVGLDLVGHVPHDIPVRHAAQMGMRTMEHLKGWLNDRTLEMGERDYDVVHDFPGLWVTPTLYSTQDSLHGAAAATFLRSPEAAYVSASRRMRWQAQVNAVPTRLTAVRDAQRAKMVAIVRELHKKHARFLAGTDADGYAFTVAGFGLVDEFRLMRGAGLSPAEVLRSATSEPARAFRHPGEFGQVKPGMRADLVLLPRNPLLDPTVYWSNLGVMANGRWLAGNALERALTQLAAIYAQPTDGAKVDANTLAAWVAELSAGGFVFDAATLANAATAFGKSGHKAAGARIQAIANAASVCVARS